jgi:hypothetical protein
MIAKPSPTRALTLVARLDVVPLRALVIIVVHIAARLDRISRINFHNGSLHCELPNGTVGRSSSYGSPIGRGLRF